MAKPEHVASEPVDIAKEPLRVLVFGAHPDDAEVYAAGLLVRQSRLGHQVKIVSVTDGRNGHHELPPDELVRVRRAEAERAGKRIGAEYVVWDFPDGALEATLKVRWAIISEIRRFAPDLVLTHRPNDYHPDHRAVGTAVQDASYLVTVPHICPEIPALRVDPVVAYMCDLFTRPAPLQPDVLLDISAEFDVAVQMAACHESQFFQWLPWHDGILDQVPQAASPRFEWLCSWFSQLHQQRREHFQAAIVARGLALEEQLAIEVYEVSQYAGKADEQRLSRLFPGML
ncbi:MAG: PIG-L family deacetylase [Aureliella sp.]